ncbi:hypothetical protein CHO01_29000 [Cellulomonas hominis]|uniref:Excisionase n=1 Tax=Cellulomonas hominis TaxID=156981 RepID=A0A511FGS1_9CELL|nr:DUF2637 domain-containing protein [Cellulomonas hominis]MBB5474750.1 hypothetical protein [Cellulomonas hominis]NKY05406.1 DUF2637 domain-containing protein [Cellulomonas hominis]GEL47784.1 hypothetical protein CHO01_29000 [Cellulomonas hominis]
MSRARSARPVARAALISALIGTALIAAGAFWLSFEALADLACRAGVPDQQVWVWPLVVDGVILVSTVAVFALRGHSAVVSAYPWGLLIGGVVVSVAANGVHAALSQTDVPSPVAVAVATIPPLALVGATHLSVLLADRVSPGAFTGLRPVRRRIEQPAAPSEPAGAGSTPDSPAPRRPGAPKAVADEAARAWYDAQVSAGLNPTGAMFAETFGVSAATGRRRLAALRGELTSV